MPRPQRVAANNAPIRGTAQKVQKWAAGGSSKRAVAKSLGVSLETLNEWMERHPRLRDAWYAGREEEHQRIYNRMMAAIDEGNVTAMIWMMKTRHDYREHAPIADANAPRITINLPSPMTPEQFRALRQPGRVIDHDAAPHAD